MSKRPSPVLLLLGVCAAAFGALAALGITTMQITVEARPVEPPLSVTVRSEDPVITSAIIALAAVGGVASAGLFVRIFILPIFEMIRLSRIIMRRTRERGDQHQALSKRLQAYADTLEEEIARNTAILDSIADGVVVRDRTGRVILTNPAAYALLDTDGEFDTSMLGVYRPNQDPSRRKRRLQIGERTISLSAAPVRAGDGEIIGEVLVLRDITDEAIAERTKNNFLNQIGHELRTPLTAIQGFSETLAVGWDKLAKESRERAVKGIYEQTRLLAQIINELIELTAIRSSPGGLRRARIDLHTLIEKTLETFQAEFDEAGMAVVMDGDPTGPDVNGDPSRLRHAIEALIRNAIQYSPHGGTLRVTVGKVGGEALIVFQDEGVGISKRDLSRVFERFFRGRPVDDKGHTIDVRGMGQGLYAVKSIVEAHQGDVSIESEPQRGTKVTIRLPVRG